MQAQVLLKELAAVVDAETGSAMSDYALLKDMNQVAETKYAGMVQHVKTLQPAMQVTSCACSCSITLNDYVWSLCWLCVWRKVLLPPRCSHVCLQLYQT